MESSYKNDSVRIAETIRALRQNKNINQDVLAEALSVSTQAVSKWETGASMPDVLMIPRIAEYFGVTTDHIYFGGEMPPAAEGPGEPAPASLFPDDGVLRVVQFMGGVMLSAEELKGGEVIELSLGEAAALAEISEKQIVIPIEIHGSAVINGTVNGNVGAEGDISCGTVNGSAAAGGDLRCTTVNGNISAVGNVTASRVVGSVSAAGTFFGEEGGDHDSSADRTEREAERAARRAERNFEEEAERAARRYERRFEDEYEKRFMADWSKSFGRKMGQFGKELGQALSGGKRRVFTEMPDLPFPDDGVLRVVQFFGTKPAVWREGRCRDAIPLEIEAAAAASGKYSVDVCVYGNTEISGDVSGSVTADGDVSCCNIDGNVISDGDVSCENVNGHITAEGDVECGDVSGNISAEGDVECGDVGGNISAEGDVECGDVKGSISCEGSLECGSILGDVKSCEGDIECESIGGNVRCEGDIHMG